MKRVKNRAYALALLAGLLVIGTVLYVVRFIDHGAQWAMFSANRSVYRNGCIMSGRVTDRFGVVLAQSEDGERSYADDAKTRLACLHAAGDFEGNIGTGAVTAFAGKMAGYSLVTGVSDSGGTVTLTLDAELNRAAYDALGGRRGAVMVMDYTTGEVLCMVSTPSYDPETGFDANDPAYSGAYINRCLSSAYTPGSVFKLVTLAAAIENIPDLYSRSFYCGGSVDVSGVTVKCAGVHGSQTVEQALANSCNCAFAQISLELGSDTLAKYAKALGFTQAQTLSGIETRAGSFDAAASGSADLAWSGIGQYTDLVCPYSMLRYVSAIANGGSLAEPPLLLGEKGGKTALLKPETAEKIADMMSYNVTCAYGTGTFPGLAMCAKSGTAETGDGSSHAWFTGFLSDAEHPYAFVVVIENGGGGLRNAGPVANAVLQAAVKKDYSGDKND